MIDLLLYLLLCIAGFILLLIKSNQFSNKHNNLGITGKLIWIDKGNATKPFFNNDYKVLGKPDLMYRIPGGVLAVEYKNRRSGIYNSDIIQAKSAALAARGSGYKVTRILVKTKTQQQYFSLPKKNTVLFSEIEKYVSLTRCAKTGSNMKAVPSTMKCRNCAFMHKCKYV